VAAQFHPEFKSRVMCPAPLFVGLLRAAAGQPVAEDIEMPQTPRKKAKRTST